MGWPQDDDDVRRQVPAPDHRPWQEKLSKTPMPRYVPPEHLPGCIGVKPRREVQDLIARIVHDSDSAPWADDDMRSMGKAVVEALRWAMGIRDTSPVSQVESSGQPSFQDLRREADYARKIIYREWRPHHWSRAQAVFIETTLMWLTDETDTWPWFEFE